MTLPLLLSASLQRFNFSRLGYRYGVPPGLLAPLPVNCTSQGTSIPFLRPPRSPDGMALFKLAFFLLLLSIASLCDAKKEKGATLSPYVA